jgi:hypothetical protein
MDSAWTAPDSCLVIPCAIDSMTVGVQGACDEVTNTYTQDVTVYYSNEPDSGNLNVNGQLFAISGSPQAVTLTGLNSDGGSVNLTALFDLDSACTATMDSAWTAPDSCLVIPCAIDSVVIGVQGPCAPGTNRYTQEVTVYYSNGPTTGNLDLNGLTTPVTGSPQTVVLGGLDSDGLPVDLTVLFDADSACVFTQDSAWIAPENCIPPPSCSIDSISIGAQTSCSSGDNTFAQVLTVYYQNAPGSGSLSVNGQLYAVSGSPQTLTLTGLPALGGPQDVELLFTEDSTCNLAVPAAFTQAPPCVPCTTQVPTGLLSEQLGSGSFRLSWDFNIDYVSCRLNGRQLGAPAFALIAINGSPGNPPTSAVVGASALIDGRSYEWKVRCACTVPPAPTDITPFSTLDTFTYFAPRHGDFDESLLTETELDLFPNPANSAGLYIAVTDIPDGEADLEIIDMQGRVVMLQTITAFDRTAQVYVEDAGQLPAGQYILRLTHAEGVVTQQFVKSDE